jgi:hypothetical protein
MTKFFSPGENLAYDTEVEKQEAVRHAQYERIQEKHEAERQRIALREQLVLEQNTLDKMRERAEVSVRRAKERAERIALTQKQALTAQRIKVEELKRKLSPEDDRRRDRLHAVASRREAEAAGAKTYLTGLACRNGHVAHRYVSSGACVECDAMYASPGYTKRRQPKQAT